AGKGLKYISQLFLDRRADPNVKDSSGQTALHHAAKNGHEAIAQLLLQHGAQKGEKDNKGRTALGLAILKL
ncbi:ankyrin repeat-containing domain protein, partial [Trichophaea hybrida]